MEEFKNSPINGNTILKTADTPSSEQETECPRQVVCKDFSPTTLGKTCVHYDIDEHGNDECHSQYDEEEWDVEEVGGWYG